MLKKILFFTFIFLFSDCYVLEEQNLSEHELLRSTVPTVRDSTNHTVFHCDMSSVSSMKNFSVAPCKILEYVLIAIELFKLFKSHRAYKKNIEKLSYEDFKDNFPHLVSVEQKIEMIQKLIAMSNSSELPEQVMARIYLVRIGLCPPYDKVLNKCACKLYEQSFDDNGQFIWSNADPAVDAYKKFYKKVPQSYKSLALCFKKILHDEARQYISSVAHRTYNEYNQRLLDIIYAGIEKNFPRLKKLCRTCYDQLIQRLYQYYVNQKSIESKCEDDELDFFSEKGFEYQFFLILLTILRYIINICL